ncbi:MAG: hypothetical protein IJI27_03130 [Oscillospiraceae bacterium]|nr:hypothetical protein [Oscillospiraceae bacterium]
MKQARKRYLPRVAVVCAAVMLVLALAATAYAADLGGIQRTIQIWVHGDQTDAVLNVEAGEYSLSYTDENGEQHEEFGGGKAFDMFGRERDVTEEELREYLDMPDVEYREDGSVWVYYHSQKIEITDTNKQNNYAGNLEWTDHAWNMKHAYSSTTRSGTCWAKTCTTARTCAF